MSAYGTSTRSTEYADLLEFDEAAALAGTQGVDDYAIIGDLHSAALVSKAGSIDWLCLPFFDSSSCFAALLDSPDAGRWLLAPASETKREVKRQYLPDTLVLETWWTTKTNGEAGEVKVTDFMPLRDHPYSARSCGVLTV